MGTMFKIEDYLTDNLEENAGIISDILLQVRAVISNNGALAKIVPLTIKDKNQNEQARFQNLLSYVLDRRTLEYLDENYSKWLASPSIFDANIKSSQWAFFTEQTRPVSEYLDTEQDIV